MALADLATTLDLSARGVAPNAVHSVMLKVASATIRGAAGGPISQTTSAVSLTAWGEERLALPGRPVTSVASVSVDGVATTDWMLTDSAFLYRACGWGHWEDPVEVAITLAHGLPTIPVDIVQLTCDLAILGANAAPEGAQDPRVFAEKIDDYSVTYKTEGRAVSSAMELPAGTKASLAARFGGGVDVVRNRA